jgi:hypothetical protein
MQTWYGVGLAVAGLTPSTPIFRYDFLLSTDLSNSDLSNTDLSNADLSDADLSNTDLSYRVTSELGILKREHRLENDPEEAWRGAPLNEARQEVTFRTGETGYSDARSGNPPAPAAAATAVIDVARVRPGASKHQ